MNFFLQKLAIKYWQPLSYTHTMSKRLTPQSEKNKKQKDFGKNTVCIKTVSQDTAVSTMTHGM